MTDAKPLTAEIRHLLREAQSAFPHARTIALLRDDVEQLLDENARLAAVVERLPKTADGVPMRLGSEFYYNYENHDTAHPYLEVLGAGVIGMARDWVDHETFVDDIHYRNEDGVDGEISPSRCYSTREAALAALGEQP